MTPNAAEAERVTDVSLGNGEERIGRAKDQAKILRERTGAEVVTVTLDRTGTLTLRPYDEPYRTHAHPAPEKQASGAGDVFVAALTVARAAGLPWSAAASLAQNAAGVAVNAEGTCVCTLDELRDWVGQQPRRVKSQHELAEALDAHQRSGERIVFTNGCFDVLHRGHTSYLRQARELGDVLVVAVNSDSSVRRLKGPDRPINSAVDRANVVADLAFVDYVTVFDADTPRTLIERFRPDVYAKGGDYTPEMLQETAIVRELGGEVVTLDYVKDHSTTELIDRMRTAADSAAGRLRTTGS